MALPRGVKAAYLTRTRAAVPAPAALPTATAAATTAQPVSMEQAASIGWEAYLWGWPLVNFANRASRARALNRLNGGPVIEGGMPVAFGRLAMLTGYINPDERGVACPNQDVVYGAGIFDDLDNTPIVFQLPDFGHRFWSFAFYDARTNEFGSIGKQAGTAPGFYLLVGPNWQSATPTGITAVVKSPTNLAFTIPRVYAADTAADMQAVQPLVRAIDYYPLDEFNGVADPRDWDALPHTLPCWLPRRRDELQFVKPETFLRDLRGVVDAVPPLPGEDDLYARLRGMLASAAGDWRVRMALRETFRYAEQDLIGPLMQWARNGRPAGNGWNTSVNAAQWGTSAEDYLHRAATARSNIFESRPSGTRYYYTDTATNGEPLTGDDLYAVTFAVGQLPPVRAFWSLSLYDEFHFFYTRGNPLDRYALGTKDEGTLRPNPDGSLTLYAGGWLSGGAPPSNWLPAPVGEPFSLYLRAYQPDPVIDAWPPPSITRIG